MRVLVTGATGFVGWHATRSLLGAGHSVRALVRSADKALRVLAPLGLGPADFAVGDMTDAEAVDRALAGCDGVLHAAAAVELDARAGGGRFDTNVEGTRLVLGGAHARGLRHLLFVSSLLAIFDPRSGRLALEGALASSSIEYGNSKLAAERVARELQGAGAPLAIVYPSGVIGPEDPGLSESVRAYRSFTRRMLTSASGTQFVDARDLAELMRRLLERGAASRTIAAGHFFPWRELADRIEAATGAKVQRLRAPDALLRAAGRLADRIARWRGVRSPLSAEGMEIATRWRRIDDTPDVAALGVAWRDPAQTLEDLYRWLWTSGRLPATALPRLAAAGQDDAA